MKKVTTVVTAGADGADVDVLACATAYAELLRLEGSESVPVVEGQFTASITPTVQEWYRGYETTYSPDGSERFVLVDISDPTHFSTFVDLGRVSEVFDHRHGFEDYWKERLGDNSHIELVGACGTLIWEEFKKRDHDENISEHSAKLLSASIVSNTLNFQASNTTPRDHTAYSELEKKSGLTKTWIAGYFEDQEKTLFTDFGYYLASDTRVFAQGDEKIAIGQLELWDAERVIHEKQHEMFEVMKKYADLPWFINILNISKGFSYIFTQSDTGKKLIEKKLGVRLDGNVAKTPHLLLRKQIRVHLEK